MPIRAAAFTPGRFIGDQTEWSDVEDYHIRLDGTFRVVDDEIELANGLGFSPDDLVLYFTDSAARCIYAYDVHAERGELFNKRTFVSIPDDEGIPDGLTVDNDGFVWSALWYGSQVIRYDPDGQEERRLSLPVNAGLKRCIWRRGSHGTLCHNRHRSLAKPTGPAWLRL